MAGKEESGVGVTLKQDKGYEAPWITFGGSTVSEVKSLVAEAAGLEGQEDLPLVDVTLNASRAFRSAGAITTGLDAEVIPMSRREAKGAPKANEEPERDEGSQGALEALREALKGAESVKELKRLYRENSDLFKEDPSLMDVYKATGRALTKD